MKKTTRTMIMAAAVTGLLGGAAVNRAYSADKDAAPGKAAPASKSPKLQSCAGQNDCKGIGGCKTKEHDCKFKNDCKGKGGCEITKEDIKNWEKMQKDKKK